jgi:hypothetical protein
LTPLPPVLLASGVYACYGAWIAAEGAATGVSLSTSGPAAWTNTLGPSLTVEVAAGDADPDSAPAQGVLVA